MNPNFVEVLKGALLERVNSSQVFNINFDIEDRPDLRKIVVIGIIHTFTYLRYAQEYSYEMIEQTGSVAADIVSSTFVDELSVSLHKEIDKVFGTSLD